jgi:hypothetical protein
MIRGTTILIAGLLLALGLSAQTQTTFATPDDAAKAIVAAVAKGDDAALAAIFGQPKHVFTTGDAKADKAQREEFARAAKGGTFTEISPANPNQAVVFIGASGGYPVSLPLIKENGKWRVDTKAPTSGRKPAKKQ